MTLSGDEPSLARHDDQDNSPMLNHNRLLMDAREAYESGWLLGLTERMSEAQKHRFREAITGQGLHYFWNSVIITELMDEEQFFVYRVGEWVHEPTPENFHVIEDQLRSYILRWNDTIPLTLDDVYEAFEWADRADDLAALIWCILAESLQDAARSAAGLARMTITEPWRAGEFDYDYDFDDEPGEHAPPPRKPLDDIPRRRAEAQRWQIEAAWAILHDEPLPPYPEFRRW